MMRIDHVGIVVADMEAALAWYTEVFGLRVVWREAETEVDDVAIGLPGERVRLTGAILETGASFLELHEYVTPRGEADRRVCDTGFGHIAFYTDDIHSEFARLSAAGMEFNAEPREITSGGLTGFWWAYGKDPWGNVIEICHHPDPDVAT